MVAQQLYTLWVGGSNPSSPTISTLKRMKISTTRCLLLAVFTVALGLAFAPTTHAQAEKVKQKAKDLKKQVENPAPKTNAPPVKPVPKK